MKSELKRLAILRAEGQSRLNDGLDMNWELTIRDKSKGSTDAPFWNEVAKELLRLRMELEAAHAGFGMAHDALEKKCYDEAMLHCGYHHAKTWKALLPNVKYTP